MSKIEAIKQDCQQRRNKSIREKRHFRDEQKQKDKDLQNLLEELEGKYHQQWLPFSQRMGSRVSSCESLVSDLANSETSPSPDIIENITNESRSRSRKSHVVEENPVILRSYLDEDSDWVSNTGTSPTEKHAAVHSENSFHKERQSNHLESTDESVTRKKSGNKKDSRKWKPEKEWNNDFISPTYLEQNDNKKMNERTNQNTTDHLDSLSVENKITVAATSKKPAIPKKPSYKPNLQVAQSSLKLKRKESS